ncbi:SAM-dependent methyltransferase, partial [Staphylococcus capitis]
CNPPYFKQNQLHQHQKEAHKIARHEIMCSLEDCMFAARHLLKQGGRLVMVHRAERLMDVLTEMRQANIEPKRIVFIYSK